MENNRNVILIADDVEINREMLALMFEEQYEVALAENGQEAIDYLNQNVERVACLLLDLIMPVKTGFDVMEYMKQEGMMKSVPIILITGYNAKEVEESGYDYGVADIIFKPFDANIVMRRVKNVVDLYLHMNHMEELVKRQTADLQAQAESMRRNNEILIDALGHVVDFRIPGAMNHSSRIKKFTSLLLKYVPQVRPDIEMSQERMDMLWEGQGRYESFQEAFADSIRDALKSSIETAGGISPDMQKNRRGFHTAYRRAKEWFVSSYPLLGAVASGFHLEDDAEAVQRMHIPVAAVDPHLQEIYINSRCRMNYHEWKFVLAHEFLHAALRHHGGNAALWPRAQGREWRIFAGGRGSGLHPGTEGHPGAERGHLRL